jgi:phospholipase C
VFTEHADHTSKILFMGKRFGWKFNRKENWLIATEEWLEALGYEGARTTEIPVRRRAHMSNLVNAFDFDHVSNKNDFLHCILYWQSFSLTIPSLHSP